MTVHFDSTRPSVIPQTFGAGLLPPPVQTDLWGNPLTVDKVSLADRQWWASHRAFEDEMARIQDEEFERWVLEMDAAAGADGIRDADLIPPGGWA